MIGGMIEEGLPIGWTKATLSDVSDRGKYGWTTKAAQDGEVKFLRTTDITKGPINWSTVPFCAEAPFDIESYLVRPRDLLISRAGSVGFSALIREIERPTVFASYLIRFVPSVLVDERYLAAFLKSPDYWDQISDASAGIALANVNASQLSRIQLPLAPLAEQKRIADKLEAVLGRVDACRARLDRVPALLKRFRQSVLAAATSGKLTEEWRTSRKVAPWPERPLGSLCEQGRIITYGVIKLGDETPKGVPCLRTSNVRWLNIDITGMKRIEKSLSNEYSRTILKGGEVLVNVRGTLGGVAVAEEGMAGWNVSREVAVVPLDQAF